MKDNIKEYDSDYFISNDNLEQIKKDYTDDFQPEWVRIAMKGISSYQTIDHNGMVYHQNFVAPNSYVDVPKNLVDDVENGAINPLNFTKEELLQLSRERHQRELELADMTMELPVIDEDLINSMKK